MILIIEGQTLIKKTRVPNSNRQPTRSVGVSRISTTPDLHNQMLWKRTSKHSITNYKELVQKNFESISTKLESLHQKRKVTIPDLIHNQTQISVTPFISKPKIIYLQAKRKLYFKNYDSSQFKKTQ